MDLNDTLGNYSQWGVLSDKILTRAATTPEPWYIAVVALVTHLPLLSNIVIAWLHRNKCWEMGMIFILEITIFCASMTYHTCQTTAVCLFNVPEYIWQQNDNIFAFGGQIPILILTTSAVMKYRSLVVSTTFWSQAAYLSPLGLTVIMVLTSITGPGMGVPPEKALIVILFGICILFAKILFADQGRVYIFEHYNPGFAIGGYVSVVVGVAFFLIELNGYDWLFHGLWHLFVFTGTGLLMLGTVAMLPEPSIRLNSVDIEIILSRIESSIVDRPLLKFVTIDE